MAKESEQQKTVPQANASLTITRILSNRYFSFLSFALLGLALIGSITAIGMALMALNKNKLHNQQRLHQTNEGNERLRQIDEQYQTLTHRLTSLEKQQTENKNQLEEKVATLHNQLNQRFNEPYNETKDWQLLKARYYLQLAQMNAQWHQNIEISAHLLKQADDLLKGIDDPRLLPIRQALANELATIRAIPKIDQIGILSRLETLQQQLEKLPLSTPEPVKKTAEEEHAINTWKQRLQNSIHLLEKIVIVRKQNDNWQGWLPLSQKQVLKAAINLSLQEAQWAVIYQKPRIYKLALKQAVERSRTLFTTDQPETIAYFELLTQLQKTPIEQKQPHLGQALLKLNNLLENKATPQPLTKKGQP